MADTITNESFQDLIDDLTKGGPVVGEKKYAITDFFHLKDTEGNEQILSNIDILKRADDTFWMPLEADRHTLTNITAYQIYTQTSNSWSNINDWFETEAI